MNDVVPMRQHQEPEGFQYALRTWRKFAHSRGLVVASPARLIGAERTFLGDSDEDGFGPKDYTLINSDLLFKDLPLSEKEKAILTPIANTLIELSEVDIADCRAPLSASVPELEDERGRWDLFLTKDHRVGTVVRTGDGAKKHYRLFLWDGSWYAVRGQPCFDLPMFGLPELRQGDALKCMIHEGPKARLGACQRDDFGQLEGFMRSHVHLGWHGADYGMDWTDWSPLRGRKVHVWSDMDDAGISNARMLAKKLARMGMVIDIMRWGEEDIEASDTWDWADPIGKTMEKMSKAEMETRIERIESPFDARGHVLREWAKRSFVDRNEQEVYQASTNYQAQKLQPFNSLFGKNAIQRIMESDAHPFIGRTYLPGKRFGRIGDGRVNLARPSRHEPIVAKPLDRSVMKTIWRKWLARMIPDVHERKHFIRKAAWAIFRPEKVSQHMIVLKGDSGIGKSVVLDLIADVAGKDRASAIYPDSIFKSFNDSVKDRTILCIHEIHSDDMTRKQNAGRLKELLGNSHITIRQKFRDDETRENVISWFGATNEKVPFAMYHGNDRFFFVQCASPQPGLEKVRMDRFFREWLPRFRDPEFLCELYQAAKHIVLTTPEKQMHAVLGRSKRQKSWAKMEKLSLRQWEQKLLGLLDEIYAQEGDEKHPVLFFGEEMQRLVMRDFKNAGLFEIAQKMSEFGYRRLRTRQGSHMRKSPGRGQKRESVWCKVGDMEELMSRIENREFESFTVRSLGGVMGD